MMKNHNLEDKTTPLQVRMPFSLRQELKLVAKKNGRSLNSEIVARLNSTFQQTTNPDAYARINRMIESLYELRNQSVADHEGEQA